MLPAFLRIATALSIWMRRLSTVIPSVTFGANGGRRLMKRALHISSFVSRGSFCAITATTSPISLAVVQEESMER